MSPKIYATTQARPPGDVLSLIGAPRHFSIGNFATYVLAESKAAAAYAIHNAYRGASVDARDLKVATGKQLGPLVEAGLLDTADDVIATDGSGRYGVVRVRGAAEADGDPHRVGVWETRQDADDITYTVFVTVGGTAYAIPVDEAFRRAILADRAEKAAAAKIEADAGVAIDRVTAFLAEVERRSPGSDAIADLDRPGVLNLTVTDLRALLAAAAKVA
jgi:hypothetical protein